MLTSGFFTGNVLFLLSEEINVKIAFLYIFCGSSDYYWALTNVIVISIMPAKLATPGLPKIIIFWNKGYDIIIKVCDINSKTLSNVTNYIVNAVMLRKFYSSSKSLKDVIIILIL